ncbi:MAG: hypothetical protein J4O01_08700 [Chloroflexi bacterium]|nr:hypothetical protein [Chloroflexota bacterium]MCI0808734.1 hypothetical protein [Chloroflexota bacterium]MCI0836535.1 hypothetical protein [Chloroflexota bacterium]MCI0852116.1 hypothetical protein [Chloroflexota bacterium]MCI0871325.1 hypothetical protein [Chloroflexota bacterium]
MAAEDARIKAGLKTAEDELNLIKNQVQQTLLDIREHILDVTNPFNAVDDALTDEDEIEFDDLMGGGSSGPAGAEGTAGADGAARAVSEGDGDDGEGDGDEDLESADGDGESVEKHLDDAADDPVDEIIEEIPDGGYVEEEIIDDGGGGGGMPSAVSDPDEYFEEEEEIPEEIEEEFKLDEEPANTGQEPELEGSGKAQDGTDAVDGADGAADSALAPVTANFDVLTMAGLVRWVAVTTDRLGANRTEIMLDAFEAAGRIAPSTRVVLHHLMALTEEDPSVQVPVREIVSAMVRMEGVLDTSAGTDSNRLLSMLMDVEDDPLDRLIA